MEIRFSFLGFVVADGFFFSEFLELTLQCVCSLSCVAPGICAWSAWRSAHEQSAISLSALN